MTITGSDPNTPDLILGGTTGGVGTYQISGGKLLVDNLSVGGGNTIAGSLRHWGILSRAAGTVSLTQSGDFRAALCGRRTAGSNRKL